MNTQPDTPARRSSAKLNEGGIAILDFGGQYAHLIANRIRRIGVHAVIEHYDTPADKLKHYKGLILSGGPQSVNAKDALLADPNIFKLEIPILGICYGHQVTSKVLGGTISPGTTKEYGKTKLYIDHPVGIFEGIGPGGSTIENSKLPARTNVRSDGKIENSQTLRVWMSHWDEVTDIPVDFEVLAHTDINDFAAVGNLDKHIYGIQFHPEVTHTEQGMKILENFVNLTGASKSWTTENYLEQIQQEILEQVQPPLLPARRSLESVGGTKRGEEALSKRGELKKKATANLKVFMLVSGGVDSMVGFTLLNKVLGEDQVYGMLVDTGFMRKGEIEEVTQALNTLGYKNLHVYDGKEEFFKALKGVSDPEEKREIIGKKFIDIQAKAVHELNLDPEHWMLGQGTIYPDTIESGGTEEADKIKTHHNRVPEIQEMIDKGLVIEPLKDLYKDEVRQLGEQIGLPHHLVWRHPFPGPGLAIRILCSEKKPNDQHLRPKQPPQPTSTNESAAIKKYLKPLGLSGTVLPLRSVGVQGDARTYRHPLALSPTDEKTWKDHWNKEKLQELSTLLTNEFEFINRVLFTLQSSSPSFTLIPNKTLTQKRVRFLQEADKIVMDEIDRFDLEEKTIWQCPTVLLPVTVTPNVPDVPNDPNGPLKEALLLRPVSSIDAMTADFTLIPEKNLNKILDQLEKLKPSAIFYDLTNKPPGTIEWE